VADVTATAGAFVLGSVPLVSLARVKEFLPGVSASTADDAVLQTLTVACSDWIRTYCERTLTLGQQTLTRRGHGGPILTLPQRPVVSVQSVSVAGIILPESLSPSASGWALVDDSIWLTGFCFIRGSVVIVRYTAGYDPTAIPDGLQQACVELVARRYKERTRIGETSKVIGADSTTVAYDTGAMPEDVKMLLGPYRRATL
jgi:hypothetical protein